MTTFSVRPLQALLATSALILTLNAQAADNAADTPTSAPSASSETLGQHVDDATLTTKVKSTLLATDGLHSTHIHVKSRNGTVWLTGSVPVRAEKAVAVRATLGVDGVKHVRDHLRVNAHPDKTWVEHKKAQVQDATSAPSSSGPSSPDEHH